MKKTLFLLFAFALFSYGCSSIRLFYSNADWYLQHRINGYTSFNTRQENLIRRDVSNYMRWHRKYALPEYITFLQNLNGAVQYGGHLDSGDIALLRAHLLGLYQKTMAPAVRPAAEILGMLDAGQLKELEHNLDEENRQQLNRQFDAGHDVYLSKRADKTLNFLEWLAGDLSAEQKRKIGEMSRALPVVGDIYIRHRQENQKKLLGLLNAHAGEQKIAAFLRTWIFSPEVTRSTQQQNEIQAFDLASNEMIVQIRDMLTAKQKAHIHQMISSYIDYMRAEIRKSRQDSGQ
ncbi:MAG TPA: DUF6279 family lipoprotein [Gallionella sp.]|nr:DUF6279 family lipoprotein [Gallionella sp.]